LVGNPAGQGVGGGGNDAGDQGYGNGRQQEYNDNFPSFGHDVWFSFSPMMAPLPELAGSLVDWLCDYQRVLDWHREPKMAPIRHVGEKRN
jgi:hypothetical protein